ncbi:MAG: histidine phosphatase family protein [Magnetococcales bacterium]|nr:histidine phosphatase family protein [Magnetococcales bacterium]
MARHLIIMRHAKSAWDTDAITDFERPLAKRGKIDAPRMGQWLLDQSMVPDYIVSSPAQRAKETTLKICKAMNIKKSNINWDPRVYGAGTEDLLEILSEIPSKNNSVMLVGHNPGLEFLASYLTQQVEELEDESQDMEETLESNLFLIKTATVVSLKMPDDWKSLKSGSASIVTIQHPRDLAPDPDE